MCVAKCPLACCNMFDVVVDVDVCGGRLLRIIARTVRRSTYGLLFVVVILAPFIHHIVLLLTIMNV